MTVVVHARRQKWQYVENQGEVLVPVGNAPLVFYNSGALYSPNDANYTLSQEDPPLIETTLETYVQGSKSSDAAKKYTLDLTKDYTIVAKGTVCKPQYAVTVKKRK